MGISFLKAASQIHLMLTTRPLGFDHWLGKGLPAVRLAGSDGGLNDEDSRMGLSFA
jgi:hypothetical protein